jgi:stromal membrane-associated protein
MESFIRSKYESRRWAMEGPPPSDPSTLDNGSAPSTRQPEQQANSIPATARSSGATDSSSRRAASPIVQAPLTTRQPQSHQLLSSTHTKQTTRAGTTNSAIQHSPTPEQPQQKAPENDLFSLDFHAPPVTASTPTNLPKKDVKQDILSLFSTPAAPAAAPPYGQFGAATQPSPWAQAGPAQPQAQPTSMVGSNGTGMWGTSSGWSGATPVPPAQGNLWGTPTPTQQQTHQALSNMSDLWGSSATASGGGSDMFNAPFASSAQPKKDDVFGDLWGEFK